jgi:site-specific recombinase XerD
MTRRTIDDPDPTGKQTHGEGIYSTWSKRKACRVYTIQYWHTAPGKKAQRKTETVPADKKDGRHRLESARRLKAKREREKHDPEFIPPPVAKRQKAAAEKQHAIEEQMHPLLFESARDRFLKRCLHEYSRPESVRSLFRKLELAFGGRRLDEITRPIVRQYYEQRIERSGPFKDEREVSMRTPQTEITLLSALYTFLEDEGHEIANPCHRPRTRRKAGPLRAYKPAHVAVIPDDTELRAIFDAAEKDEQPAAAAFVKLCYFTASRPESEPCLLRHGDVELIDGTVTTMDGSPALGELIYRDTKTGDDRRLPIHPDLADALRAVMEDRPTDPLAEHEWKARPIFRKGGRSKHRDTPWTSSSYRGAWERITEAVTPKHPRLASMWLRDLRSTAKTHLIDRGVTAMTANKILGHRGGVAEGYYHLTDATMRAAILTLGPRAESAAEKTAVNGGNGGKRESARKRKAAQTVA